MAMVAMGGHRHITATVDPVALVQVGVIPIEEGVAAGATGDPIHLHGSDTLNGSPRSSVDLTRMGVTGDQGFTRMGNDPNSAYFN